MKFKEYLTESDDIRTLMKKFGISQKTMMKHQPEYKTMKWSIYGGIDPDNTFSYDFKDLTEKGKVMAILGLVNDLIKFNGKKLVLTKKGMNR